MIKQETTKILIDADIVAYRAACKTDGRYYKIGDNWDKYKADLVTLCKQNNLLVEHIEVKYKPQSWHKCIRELRSHWTSIIERVCALCSIDVNSSDNVFEVQGFLTGDDNFRKKLFKDYKANRKLSRIPEHLNRSKQWLVDNKKCIVTQCEEADDMISITHCNCQEFNHIGVYSSVICSIDKDFDTVTGWHYNWDRDDLYFINEFDAAKFFYTQMLTGDSTDGIKGLSRVGKKTAAKLLSSAISITELEYIVLKEYRTRLKDKDKADEYFLLTGRLLHLRRKKEELWESFILSHEKKKQSNKKKGKEKGKGKGKESGTNNYKTIKCE